MPWDYIEELGGQTPDTMTVTTRRAWVCSECFQVCEVGAEVCGDCIAANIPEVNMSDSEIVAGPTPWELVQRIAPTKAEREQLAGVQFQFTGVFE